MSDGHDRPGPIQEPDRVAGRPAVAWWVGSMLAVAACTVVAFLVLQRFAPDIRDALPPPAERMGVGGTRGVYTARTHRTEPDSATRARLEEYRWIDQDAGVVGVPVAEAMRLLAASDSAAADTVAVDTAAVDSAAAPALESPPPLQGVGVDERPGERLPLDLTFRDEEGRTVPLGSFFAADDARPVLVVPGYFRCRMLCGVAAPRLLARLDEVEGWTPEQDYRVLLVSIDPREGPADARARRAGSLNQGGVGWTLLTGPEESVEALTGAMGFRYRYDPASDQFAHTALVVAVAPDGTIARYVYGVDPAPDTLVAVLAAARAGRSAGSLEQIIMRCFRYTPALRRYAGLVANMLRGGAVLILVGLGAVFVIAGRRAVSGGAP